MGSPSGFRLPPHSLRLHFWRRRLLWRSAWSRCSRCRPSWSCSPANVGHHFCDLKEPSSSGLVQARKIGYLPLTFFSTSLLAFGPYWVPFQSLFSLWYFAGGEEWEKRVVRVSRAHVRTGGGHGPSAPRYHLHSPRPQLHPSLPLFRIWIFIGQPHVPFLYTSSSFIDLGTPIDPTIWMRIATSTYALMQPFATQDKTCFS